ncbi:hypothetical protein ACM66B_003792 [Microbotryomycetes sp. NB124-2]
MSDPRLALPPPPPDANPYGYWAAILRFSAYAAPPSGFKARLIVVLVLLGYIVLAASSQLALTVIDHRRRKRGFWLWRLAKRHEGHYIVGNLQWLEPILILMVCIVEFLHTASEWNVNIEQGSQRNANVLKVVPFTVVLVYLWILSWAALQSFILASGDHHATLRFLTPKLANTLFIGIGAVSTAVLVALDVVSSVLSHRSWRAYRILEESLLRKAATWTPDGQYASSYGETAQEWAEYVGRSLSAIDVVRALLIFFAVFPIFTFLVNLGAFGLLMAVRRQIKLTYGGFNRDLLKREEMDVTSFPSNFKTSAEAQGMSRTGQSNERQHSISIAVIGPSPRLGGAEDASENGGPASSVLSNPEVSATHSSNSYASHQAVRSLDSAGATHSHVSRRQEGLPSRARVRELAATEYGSAVGERARGLAQLQRAESDLLITACSMTAMSIGFAALCLWVAVALESIGTSTWFAKEASVLLATYMFAIVAAVTVTLRLHQLIVNLKSSQKRRPSVATLSGNDDSPAEKS